MLGVLYCEQITSWACCNVDRSHAGHFVMGQITCWACCNVDRSQAGHVVMRQITSWACCNGTDHMLGMF